MCATQIAYQSREIIVVTTVPTFYLNSLHVCIVAFHSSFLFIILFISYSLFTFNIIQFVFTPISNQKQNTTLSMHGISAPLQSNCFTHIEFMMTILRSTFLCLLTRNIQHTRIIDYKSLISIRLKLYHG